MDLIELVMLSARRAGDKLAVRGYPFGWRVATADVLGQERDQQFQLDPDVGRTLLYMSWAGFSAVSATPPDTAAPTLARLELIMQLGSVDVIPPEQSFDSGGVYEIPSWLGIATHYGVSAVLNDGSAGATPRYIQSASGVVPLLKRIGPGGLFRIGARKTLSAGVGEDWGITGMVWCIKSIKDRE